MIPQDNAMSWLFSCLLSNAAHALFPAAKKGGGFAVVRYRRRCGERLGCFGVCAGSPARRGAGRAGSDVANAPPCVVVVATWLLRCCTGSQRVAGRCGLGLMQQMHCLALCQPPLGYFSVCTAALRSPTHTKTYHSSRTQHPPNGARNAAGGRSAARPLAGGSAGVHLRGRAQ